MAIVCRKSCTCELCKRAADKSFFMNILHHAVEYSCGLFNLLLNDCTIQLSVDPAGLHADAGTLLTTGYLARLC